MDIKDMTPEELRVPLLSALLDHVPFDGWSTKALHRAAEDLEISPELAELAYPGGTDDMLSAWFAYGDAELIRRISTLDLDSMKIREKITESIIAKLDFYKQHREVVRRTVQTLAMPSHMALGSKALWNTADKIWRAIGDASTDINYYSKRATLSAVYSSVVLYWLNDDSEDQVDTLGFIDRRIADVMKIETTKFELKKISENLPNVSRILSRIRYPSAHR